MPCGYLEHFLLCLPGRPVFSFLAKTWSCGLILIEAKRHSLALCWEVSIHKMSPFSVSLLKANTNFICQGEGSLENKLTLTFSINIKQKNTSSQCLLFCATAPKSVGSWSLVCPLEAVWWFLVPSKKGKVSCCCPKHTLLSLFLLVGRTDLLLLKAEVGMEGVTQLISKTCLVSTLRGLHASFFPPPMFWGCPHSWSLGWCCKSQSCNLLCIVPCIELSLPDRSKCHILHSSLIFGWPLLALGCSCNALYLVLGRHLWSQVPAGWAENTEHPNISFILTSPAEFALYQPKEEIQLDWLAAIT